MTVGVSSLAGLVLVPPLFRPRGAVFQHYRILDILAGVPLLIVLLLVWTALLSHPAKRRARVFPLLAVFGSLGLSWCLADGAYMYFTRVVQPEPSRGFLYGNRWDPELWFVRQPHLRWQGRALLHPFARQIEYRTDENGFRNEEGIRQADLVVVGDSFVEAGDFPEDETFARLVPRRLGLTGVNLGRGGYGPQQEMKVIERYVLSYSPKLIVWVLFEGNDLKDARRYIEFLKDPASVEMRPQPVDQLESWTTSSLTVALLRSVSADQSLWGAEDLWGVFAATNDEKYNVRFVSRYEPHETVDNSAGWNATRESLGRGLDFSRQQGIPLLVAFIPTKFRAMGPYVTFQSQQRRLDYLSGGDKWSSDQDFETALGRYCALSGLEFVSATAALRGTIARGELAYLQFDEHLSSAGQAVVADLLAHTIADRNLLRGAFLHPANR
jgi:hypothetical protein